MAAADVEVGKTDFDFYAKFAKPLILTLYNTEDRILASAWFSKLRDEASGTDKLRLDYLKLLLFVLQRRRLSGPFLTDPNIEEGLPEFTEGYDLAAVARQIIEKEQQVRREKCLKRLRGEEGDFPPFSTDYSPDLKEYVAAQDIPNFGVHVFYAISKDPITNWINSHHGVFPKAVRKMEPQGHLSETSFAIFEPRPSTPDETEKCKIMEETGVMPDTSIFVGKKSKPRKSPFEDIERPAPPLGVLPGEDEEFEVVEELPHPTWGSNLIDVREPIDMEGPEEPVAPVPPSEIILPPDREFSPDDPDIVNLLETSFNMEEIFAEVDAVETAEDVPEDESEIEVDPVILEEEAKFKEMEEVLDRHDALIATAMAELDDEERLMLLQMEAEEQGAIIPKPVSPSPKKEVKVMADDETVIKILVESPEAVKETREEKKRKQEKEEEEQRKKPPGRTGLMKGIAKGALLEPSEEKALEEEENKAKIVATKTGGIPKRPGVPKLQSTTSKVKTAVSTGALSPQKPSETGIPSPSGARTPTTPSGTSIPRSGIPTTTPGRPLATGIPTPGRPKATGIPKTPGRPVATGIPTPGRPVASGIPTPGRPVASGIPTPGRPVASGIPTPGRPVASGIPTPGRPVASGIPTPGRPIASGIPTPGRPVASGIPTPGRPVASGIPTPGRPGATGIPTPGRPRATGIPTPGRPLRTGIPTPGRTGIPRPGAQMQSMRDRLENMQDSVRQQFPESEAAGGGSRLPRLRSGIPTPGRRRLTPLDEISALPFTQGSPEADDIYDEVDEEVLERLNQLYEQLAPDQPAGMRTPPLFSKDPEIRMLAEELKYKYDASEKFVSAPEYFAGEGRDPPTRFFDPRDIGRLGNKDVVPRDIREKFGPIQRIPQHLRLIIRPDITIDPSSPPFQEEAPPEEKPEEEKEEEPPLSPPYAAVEELKKIVERAEKSMETSPAISSGVGVTTPKSPASPRRLANRDLKKEFDEVSPPKLVSSKTPSPIFSPPPIGTPEFIRQQSYKLPKPITEEELQKTEEGRISQHEAYVQAEMQAEKEKWAAVIAQQQTALQRIAGVPGPSGVQPSVPDASSFGTPGKQVGGKVPKMMPTPEQYKFGYTTPPQLKHVETKMPTLVQTEYDALGLGVKDIRYQVPPDLVDADFDDFEQATTSPDFKLTEWFDPFKAKATADPWELGIDVPEELVQPDLAPFEDEPSIEAVSPDLQARLRKHRIKPDFIDPERPRMRKSVKVGMSSGKTVRVKRKSKPTQLARKVIEEEVSDEGEAAITEEEKSFMEMVLPDEGRADYLAKMVDEAQKEPPKSPERPAKPLVTPPRPPTKLQLLLGEAPPVGYDRMLDDEPEIDLASPGLAKAPVTPPYGPSLKRLLVDKTPEKREEEMLWDEQLDMMASPGMPTPPPPLPPPVKSPLWSPELLTREIERRLVYDHDYLENVDKALLASPGLPDAQLERDLERLGAAMTAFPPTQPPAVAPPAAVPPAVQFQTPIPPSLPLPPPLPPVSPEVNLQQFRGKIEEHQRSFPKSKQGGFRAGTRWVGRRTARNYALIPIRERLTFDESQRVSAPTKDKEMKHLLSTLPKLPPQTNYPPELMGQAYPMGYYQAHHILDEDVVEDDTSPLKPKTRVHGYETPPHLKLQPRVEPRDVPQLRQAGYYDYGVPPSYIQEEEAPEGILSPKQPEVPSALTQEGFTSPPRQVPVSPPMAIPTMTMDEQKSEAIDMAMRQAEQITTPLRVSPRRSPSPPRPPAVSPPRVISPPRQPSPPRMTSPPRQASPPRLVQLTPDYQYVPPSPPSPPSPPPQPPSPPQQLPPQISPPRMAPLPPFEMPHWSPEPSGSGVPHEYPYAPPSPGTWQALAIMQQRARMQGRSPEAPPQEVSPPQKSPRVTKRVKEVTLTSEVFDPESPERSTKRTKGRTTLEFARPDQGDKTPPIGAPAMKDPYGTPPLAPARQDRPVQRIYEREEDKEYYGTPKLRGRALPRRQILEGQATRARQRRLFNEYVGLDRDMEPIELYPGALGTVNVVEDYEENEQEFIPMNLRGFRWLDEPEDDSFYSQFRQQFG